MVEFDFDSLPSTFHEKYFTIYNLFTISLPHLRELRKARTVTFLRNGDLNNAPKTIQLTPHRYIGFAELQTDLTKKLNLPHGCRDASFDWFVSNQGDIQLSSGIDLRIYLYVNRVIKQLNQT